nr:PHD finger protein 14-like [Dermatophagoides farinae]
MPKNNKISSSNKQQQPAFENAALAFVYKSLNRDPNKRKIKPVESILSMDDDLGDSESDDSDYNPPGNVDDDDVEIDSDDGDGDQQQMNSDGDSSSSSSSNETDDSDSDDDDDDSDEDGESSSEDDDEEDDENINGSKLKTKNKLLNQSSSKLSPKSSQRDHHATNSNSQSTNDIEMANNYRKILICSVCLGEQSLADDELVECDACGITVHELCYGIQADDTESIHSNASSASTEPWFCDPCKAGVKQPLCELCPTQGGIYKITDNGRWVHMVCALYTQGVTFADPEKFRGPNLSHIQFNHWGSKICMLCEDENFAQTGVCIRCDAGFCKTNFHVTCAQRQGLLTEIRSTEPGEMLDPYIAYCRLHSERQMAKKKRQNYLALLARHRYLLKQQHSNRRIEDSITNGRTLNKLFIQREKFRRNFQSIGNTQNVLTKRTPRLLDASPSAMRRLMNRCELAGFSIGRESFLIQEEMNDICRKWYIPPAFSIEYVSYYHDRNRRVAKMQEQSHELIEENKRLNDIEAKQFAKYNKLLKKHEQLKTSNELLRQKIRRYLAALSWFRPPPPQSSKTANLINDEMRRIKLLKIGQQIMSLPEMLNTNDEQQQQQQQNSNGLANANDNGANTSSTALNKSFNGKNSSASGSKSSKSITTTNIVNEFQMKKCATCKKSKEPHMMALCDSCNLYYHLHCLDPPLRRMPKKTRFGGWQCSNCTENEEQQTNDDVIEIDDDDNEDVVDQQANNKCNGTMSTSTNDDSMADTSQQQSSSTTKNNMVKKTRRGLRENPKMVTKYADYDESSNPALSSSNRKRQNKKRSILSPPPSQSISASPSPVAAAAAVVENSSSSNSINNSIRRGRKYKPPPPPSNTLESSSSSPVPTTIIPVAKATTPTTVTKCSASHQNSSPSSTKSLLSSQSTTTSIAAIPSTTTITTTPTTVTVGRKRKQTEASSILLNTSNSSNNIVDQSKSVKKTRQHDGRLCNKNEKSKQQQQVIVKKEIIDTNDNVVSSDSSSIEQSALTIDDNPCRNSNETTIPQPTTAATIAATVDDISTVLNDIILLEEEEAQNQQQQQKQQQRQPKIKQEIDTTTITVKDEMVDDVKEEPDDFLDETTKPNSTEFNDDEDYD